MMPAAATGVAWDAPRVVKYCAEEVWRQGHDVQGAEGWVRIAGMLAAWVTACDWAAESVPLSRAGIERLGALIEQDNREGVRRVPVSIAGRINRFNEHDLREMLDGWCADASVVARPQSREEAFVHYRSFELIHPFIDGNGRVGKVLLNYLAGTLHEPFFPPADFWGRPIRNP